MHSSAATQVAGARVGFRPISYLPCFRILLLCRWLMLPVDIPGLFRWKQSCQGPRSTVAMAGALCCSELQALYVNWGWYLHVRPGGMCRGSDVTT